MPDTISTAFVSAGRSLAISRSDTVALSRHMPNEDLSDALQLLPGLQINDYGGYAGLKSIAIRGMGTTHTSVMVDGVRIGNVQSGQVDLGMFGLEGVDALSIDYVNSKVNLLTARPSFGPGQRFKGKAGISSGSFGTWRPTVRLDWLSGRGHDRTLSRQDIAVSVYGTGNISRGDFPYISLTDGTPMVRENNDIRQLRAGADLFGYLADRHGEWHAKVHYSGSDRGCPGSTSWPSSDRQKDNDVFVQGNLKTTVSELYSMNLSGKVSYDVMDYISDYYSDYYKQSEVQLNSNHNFNLTDYLSVNADADLQWDGLVSDLYRAERTGLVGRVAAIFFTRNFKAEVAARYQCCFDNSGVSHNCVEPLAAFRWQTNSWLELNASARRAFRVPLFNDLYYAGIGNPDLKPEDAWMSGLGARAALKPGGGWRIDASVDGFFNYLKNKIVSAPADSEGLVWTMYNLGEAEVYGGDAGISARYEDGGGLAVGVQASGSIQLGTSIPYAPVAKAVVGAYASKHGWMLNANWNAHGRAADPYGLDISPWTTLDVSLRKTFGYAAAGLVARNIFNSRYEMVSGYPMPGASLLTSVEINF